MGYNRYGKVMYIVKLTVVCTMINLTNYLVRHPDVVYEITI